MSKKLTNLILITTMTLIILGSNIITTKAVEVPWNVGDTYKYGYRTLIDSYILDYELDEAKENIIIDQSGEYFFNLTSINNLTKTYEYYTYTSSGADGPYIADYNTTTFIGLLTLNNLFSGLNYEWDYQHNTTVMTDFGINLPSWYILEPNWTAINSQFVTIFDENAIVDTVADPYEPIIHNITLAQLLAESTSYSIQGKDNLDDAKQLFTPTTTAWSFEFDFSGVIKAGVYNSTAGYDYYYPFDNLEYSCEESYTEEGVIDGYHLNYYYKALVDDVLIEMTQLIDYWLGGLGETETSNYAYAIILPGLGTMLIVVKWISKKKK